MPNHVTNEIIFRGVDAAMQAKICEKILDAEGLVDFSILVPQPANMWIGNEGSNHKEKFKRMGMDWNRENWGTKWNAYNMMPVVKTEDSITFVFDTAWNPPYPWLAAIFNTLPLSFEHNHFDEGCDWSVHGVFRFDQKEKLVGNPWEETPASEELHKHLHFLKYGCESFPLEEG